MFLTKTEIFIFLVLSLVTVYCKNQNVKDCPRFCKCDSYMQLNRAECSSKRLISAEVNVPYQVQILDLSFNDITTVDNKCFETFSYLKYLNLSNNAIHTLDLEAFSKLRRIEDVDLSYNRLEYLDERLLERNKHLQSLNLEGNKFMSLTLKPLLKSTSLKILNLKKSQLNILHSVLFSGVPNLKQLDLTENLLNNINIEDFKTLTKLQILKLSENSLKCDQTLKNKIKQLQERAINITLNNCLSEKIENGYRSRGPEMLQKMVMASHNSYEDIDEEVNKVGQWRLNIFTENESIEEDDEDLDSREHQLRPWMNNELLKFAPDAILCDDHSSVICQHYRTCLKDLSAVWQEKQKYKEQYPDFSDIKFAFFLGTALGIALVVFILACALCVKNCFEVKKPAHIINMEDINDFPSQPLARPTTQLPPQVRRQPRRRAAPPPRAVVRYEGPVGENFISRLFGRPARHQYYRTINQNTATLIRRLSRSNLFNNRLSQHFLDRQTSVEPSSPVELGYEPSAPRPETPPPCYRDVVINNFESRK